MKKIVNAAAAAALALSCGPAGAYSGEDLLNGYPFHHFDITLRALAGDAAVLADPSAGVMPGLGFSPAAANAVAWHADYIDSYLYSPIWWAQGVTEDNPTLRIKAAFSQYDHLVKLHFDDTFSTAGIDDTWRRYAAGTIAGLEWAAQNGDVAAAYNILGVSVHAVQDFYSHSNWVDDPARRGKTWQATGPAERRALGLYSGAYEIPENVAQNSHGKVSFSCSIYGRPELKPVLDAVCTGLTPWAESSYCKAQRHCSGAATTSVSAAGVGLANALVLNPPGIALDSSWLARTDGPVRKLTDAEGNFLPGKGDGAPSLADCTRIGNFGYAFNEASLKFTPSAPRGCQSDSDRLFAASKLLAMEATAQWIDKVGAIIGARHPAFWASVKQGPAGATAISARTMQFENFAQAPFQFLSTGPYPVANNASGGRTFERSGDGYYLRLHIETAAKTNAGTDSDVKAIVGWSGGQSGEIRLDYMPTDDAAAGTRANRLLAYNDFEQGDKTVYTVGPFPAAPTSLTLFNDSADSADVFTALGEDFVSAIEGAVEGLEEAALAVISGNADYVGEDTQRLTFAEATSLSSKTLTVDAADDGKYELTFEIRSDSAGLSQDQLNAGWRRVGVRAAKLKCVRESTWDRGSSQDESLTFVAIAPLNGSPEPAKYWSFGPIEMDAGRELPMTGKFFAFDFDQINPVNYFLLPPEGVVALSMQQFESDDETAASREKLFSAFKTGVEGGAAPANKKFLDALGRSLAEDWEVGRVQAYGFYRGARVEAGTMLDQSGVGVIAGDERKTLSLNPGALRAVIASGADAPGSWTAARTFAQLTPAATPAPRADTPPIAPQPQATPTVSIPSTPVEIVAEHSQKCVDVSEISTASGAAVHQWVCHGGDNQKWQFNPRADGLYTIVARHSGMCLDLYGGSQDDGAPVIQADCHGRENQLWRLVSLGGAYQIRASHSDKCLDVRGPSIDDGALMQQWTCVGESQKNQLFKLR